MIATKGATHESTSRPALPVAASYTQQCQWQLHCVLLGAAVAAAWESYTATELEDAYAHLSCYCGGRHQHNGATELYSGSSSRLTLRVSLLRAWRLKSYTGTSTLLPDCSDTSSSSSSSKQQGQSTGGCAAGCSAPWDRHEQQQHRCYVRPNPASKLGQRGKAASHHAAAWWWKWCCNSCNADSSNLGLVFSGTGPTAWSDVNPCDAKLCASNTSPPLLLLLVYAVHASCIFIPLCKVFVSHPTAKTPPTTLRSFRHCRSPAWSNASGWSKL